MEKKIGQNITTKPAKANSQTANLVFKETQIHKNAISPFVFCSHTTNELFQPIYK